MNSRLKDGLKNNKKVINLNIDLENKLAELISNFPVADQLEDLLETNFLGYEHKYDIFISYQESKDLAYKIIELLKKESK